MLCQARPTAVSGVAWPNLPNEKLKPAEEERNEMATSAASSPLRFGVSSNSLLSPLCLVKLVLQMIWPGGCNCTYRYGRIEVDPEDQPRNDHEGKREQGFKMHW